MHEAAVQHELDPDRLSFVHALQVIQDAIAEFQMVIPDEWPTLYQRLLDDLVADGGLDGHLELLHGDQLFHLHAEIAALLVGTFAVDDGR